MATKLNAGGLEIPGNLTVTGIFNYLPRGTIVAYNQSNNAPSGWVLCNGQNGTPDLRGKFVLGNGGSRGINATGGEENVALTWSQMPAHYHNVAGNTHNAGNHNHSMASGMGIPWGHNDGWCTSCDSRGRYHRQVIVVSIIIISM